MEFGNNLRKLRKAKRLTQKQLGKEMDCSASLISKLEKGVSKPSINLIFYLAIYFNVSSDELIGFRK